MNRTLQLYIEASDDGAPRRVFLCKPCCSQESVERGRRLSWTGILPGGDPHACDVCDTPNAAEAALRGLEAGQSPATTVVVASHNRERMQQIAQRLLATARFAPIEIAVTDELHTTVRFDVVGPDAWRALDVYSDRLDVVRILGYATPREERTMSLHTLASSLGIPSTTLEEAIQGGHLWAWNDEHGRWLTQLRHVQEALDRAELALDEQARLRLHIQRTETSMIQVSRTMNESIEVALCALHRASASPVAGRLRAVVMNCYQPATRRCEVCYPQEVPLPAQPAALDLLPLRNPSSDPSEVARNRTAAEARRAGLYQAFIEGVRMHEDKSHEDSVTDPR
jgi:hypothetical protein